MQQLKRRNNAVLCSGEPKILLSLQQLSRNDADQTA
jgi:hypothetical protein